MEEKGVALLCLIILVLLYFAFRQSAAGVAFSFLSLCITKIISYSRSWCYSWQQGGEMRSIKI